MLKYIVDNTRLAIHLLISMGFRFVIFRAWFLFQQKTGLLKLRFAGSRKLKHVPSLEQWKATPARFFFHSKDEVRVPRTRSPGLEAKYKEIRKGRIQYFSHEYLEQGKEFNWLRNPVSGYVYDPGMHWSDINDLSKTDGDIKYVWELSRFGFLFDTMRYDHHFSNDSSSFVFSKIMHWIKENPVDKGPNFKCSQEISIRVLSWIFALYFYSQSKGLTNNIFQTMVQSIYDQVRHVRKNIYFSKIAVRNNHALTETLALFLSGMLFPSLPGARAWKRKGRAWFEKEVKYQVYQDGTYLQFSMNYHRVVIQLMSWAIRLAELNQKPLGETTYQRAGKSLDFLYHTMLMEIGKLPVYGANDGALLFHLNDDPYHDFRGQLYALSMILKTSGAYYWGDYQPEDPGWYGLDTQPVRSSIRPLYGPFSFPAGGYYMIREAETFSFIRCGSHHDRPSHADNLHLDLWYKGENILMDAGSFSYNTDEDLIKYFSGTSSHNTVVIDKQEQMAKGPNFIWLHWTQALNAELLEEAADFRFSGTISAYRHVRKGIRHTRTVIKNKSQAKWIIEDELTNTEGLLIRQLWHPNPRHSGRISIKCSDVDGTEIEKKVSRGWYSEYYGRKEEIEVWSYDTMQDKFITTIEIVDR